MGMVPVGVTPRFLWVEHRLDELTRAIQRYVDAGILPQQEWLDERLEHIKWLEDRRENQRKEELPGEKSDGEAHEEIRRTFFKLDPRRSPLGRCVGFEDGLDGFVIHAEACPSAGRSWSHGSSCISYMTWRGNWPEWTKK